MSVSVIIPTWNEERWLGRLLEALRAWRPDGEIVVADNESSDRTREIAAEFKCVTVAGGTPGTARNKGAAVAKGDYLLFVDADVVPTGAALRVVDAEATRAMAGAVCFRHVPVSDDRPIRFFYRLADLWFRLFSQTRSKQSLASFLLVRRDCFERLGGFDPTLLPGEDVEFVRRAGRLADVRHESRSAVLISPRRFSTEPKYWFAVKTALWGLMRAAGMRVSLFPYRWVQHDPACAEVEERWLERRFLHGD